MRLCLFVALMISIGKCSAIHRVNLEVNELGHQFTEKIFLDEHGHFELIDVPAHAKTSAATIFNNFQEGYQIQSIRAARTCYVVPLDTHVGSPEELEKGIKEDNGKFPSNHYEVEVASFLTTGDVDPQSKRGKAAKKMCGAYDVVSAIAYKGKLDVEAFAREELEKSLNGDKRTGTPTFFVCGNNRLQATATMMNEMIKCNGDVSRVLISCKDSATACTYYVQCNMSQWKYNECKSTSNSEHMLSVPYCCTYKCT